MNFCLRLNSRRDLFFILLAVVLFLSIVLLPGPIQAQTERRQSTTMSTLSDTGKPVVLERAEKISWEESRSKLVATGDVLVRYGNRQLEADTVHYYRKREVLEAFGKSRIHSPKKGTYLARYVRVNLKTGRLELNRYRGKYTNWFVSGPQMKGNPDTELQVKNGSFTTCNLVTPHYTFESDKVYIYPGESVHAYHVTFNVGSAPVMYLPYVYFNLEEGLRRWEIDPGYSSEDGMMLELGYHYLLPSDTGPYTTTVYTDMRQKSGVGGGFDVGYDRPDQHADLYAFMTRRRPTEINAQGEEIRADTVQTIWDVNSDVNYEIKESNWKFHGNVDWVENNRFSDDLRSSFGSRGVPRRRFNGSAVYSGDRSIFRVDVLREDKAVDRNGNVSFRREQDILPRVQYQLFSLPLSPLGRGIYYSANTQLQRSKSRSNNDYLFSGFLDQTVTKSVSLSRNFGQSYRLGYEQRYREQSSGQGGGDRSTGIGKFGISNTLRLSTSSSLDFNYSLERQLNREDRVPLSLKGRNLGFEENGLRSHGISLEYQWKQSGFLGTFKTGYDLRSADTRTIESDSRVLSPQMTFNKQLTPRLNWNQYFLYDYAENNLNQSGMDLTFDAGRNSVISLGANYNRRSGDDFVKLKNQLHWESSDDQWEFRSNLVYDQGQTELEAINTMVRKRLHKWDMRVYFESIEDREWSTWVTFNLTDYPSRALGFVGQETTEEFDLDLQRGVKNQIGPSY